MNIILSELPSPLGTMLLAADEHGRVRALEFKERRARLQRNLREHCGAFEWVPGQAPRGVSDALQRYFAGELRAIDEIDVATSGTDRQELAWAALRRVPAGQTLTYGAVGNAMGIADWRAAVDAGAAVGSNPIAIVVPCHRVVATNGDLKGYAWGLHRKRWLLEHEGASERTVAPPPTAALL
jgi:methylated-DNA-[protein]-cysteine S-methyltransferase